MEFAKFDLIFELGIPKSFQMQSLIKSEELFVLRVCGPQVGTVNQKGLNSGYLLNSRKTKLHVLVTNCQKTCYYRKTVRLIIIFVICIFF